MLRTSLSCPSSSTTRRRPRCGRQAGASLIEILIAVLVLAVGLVGLAALQASALQANHGSHLRSVATHLAYDIGDRMRANREAARAGGYDGQHAGLECPTDAGGIPAPSGDMAAQDLTQWRLALGCGLPGGRGEIARNGDAFIITIRWDNDRLAEDANDQTEVFVTRTGI